MNIGSPDFAVILTDDAEFEVLAVQPSRRENMHHLAIAMGLRATAARLGPGMKWFADRSAFRETRMINAVARHNELRWQLTRIGLDS